MIGWIRREIRNKNKKQESCNVFDSTHLKSSSKFVFST